ncbi:MAG: MFS transporter [Vicinamibacterales bacterium]
MTEPLRASAAGRFILVMGLVSLFGDMCYEGARSIVGPYLAGLGASAATIGFVAGFGEALGYGLRIVSGRLSDRTRRYWTFTFLGYGVNLLAIPCLGLAPSWGAAAPLVLAERVGKAVRSPARSTLVSFAASRVGVGRSFGLGEALDQAGAMAGPVLVSVVMLASAPSSPGAPVPAAQASAAARAAYGPAFAALALPALVTMVLLTLAWRWFPNPWTFEPRSAGADTRTDAFPRAFWWFLAASSLVALGFADWALVAFHLVQTRAIAPSTVPLVYAAAMGLDGLAALWFGRAFDRRGPAVLLVGVVAGSVFAPAVFLGTGESWLAIGVAAWAVGMGAMDSVFKATVATLVPPDRRGAAFGLFFAVFGLAWWAGSAVLGMLYARSITTLCVVSVVAQMAAVPPLLRVARLSRQPRENPTTRNANT